MHSCFESIRPALKHLEMIGNRALLDRFKVAIVGSRRATHYAKDISYKLAQAVSRAGGVVVSGAALGVDTYAHKGAFPNTIAVMANGLDIYTPKSNEALIKNMQQEALLMSEYAMGTPPLRHQFVERNRIVVGMSDVVVLAEASEHSGTMRSADFALAFKKPLYVLPHRLGESLGTASLVKKKQAFVIESIDGFIESIGLKAPLNSEMKGDRLLEFCGTHPTYEEAVARFGEAIFEYELLGKIRVEKGRVYLV